MVDKITMVGTLPPIQGISSYCGELVDALQKKIHVEFFTFSHFAPSIAYAGKKESTEDTPHYHWENTEVRKTLAWYNPFSWIHAGLTASGKVIHIQVWDYRLFPCFFTIAIIARLRGKPIVFTAHNVKSHETNILDRTCLVLLFGLGNRFIVHTENNKREFHNEYGTRISSIFVRRHGILTRYKGKGINKEEARKKIGIANDAKMVLFFGNIRPYKGVEDLIHAGNEAANQVKELVICIAGTPWNTEYASIIEELAKNNPHVRLHMHYIPASKVESYFTATDVVILPYSHFSSQSGVGNVALAFGKPLIVSNAGGLPELVEDTTAVYPAGNSHELSERIIKFFTNKTWQKNLEKGSMRIAEENNWNDIAEKTIEVYHSLGAR